MKVRSVLSKSQLRAAQARILKLRFDWSVHFLHKERNASGEALVQRPARLHLAREVALRRAVVRNVDDHGARPVVSADRLEPEDDLELVVRVGAGHVLPEKLLHPDLELIAEDELETEGDFLILPDRGVHSRPIAHA